MPKNEKPEKRLQKILVCITPQSNSKRLIDHASDLAQEMPGELHILHVEKGNNIFMTANTSGILQELFDYGADHGGVIHAVCGHDITEAIQNFIIDHDITRVVLGEPPVGAVIASDSVIERLTLILPHVKLDILPRLT